MAGTRSLLSLMAASVMSTTVMPTLAAAQANCDWYAKTAVRQQQINETKQCGFTGLAWHKDLAAHVTWCQSVPPDLWKAEAKKRSQQLLECEKKK